jgi:hypothetical protein
MCKKACELLLEERKVKKKRRARRVGGFVRERERERVCVCVCVFSVNKTSHEDTV